MAFINLRDTTVEINGTEITGWGASTSVLEFPDETLLGAATAGGSGIALYSRTEQRQVDVTFNIQANSSDARFMMQQADNAELVQGSVTQTNTGINIELQDGAFVSRGVFPTLGPNGEVGDLSFVIRFNRVVPDYSGLDAQAPPAGN